MAASLIADRITQIRATLPPGVRLIAVTKQVDLESMRAAYAAGVRDFGESRIQEAESKQQALQDLPGITWHLIGHLQSNKAQKALSLFQWIHSVDSLALAQRLDRLAMSLSQPAKICLQVKLRHDPNKFGWSPTELWADLPALNACNHLQIRGLMTIPPLGLSPDETLQVFQSARQLADQVRQQWPDLALTDLSMGMSDDYLLAIEAGATMVRLGQILFGERRRDLNLQK